AVLREAGSLGPLRTELQADDVIVRVTRPTTPVPVDVVWPPPPADIKHSPRVRGNADLPSSIANDEFTVHRTRLMLRRVVELFVAPWNDDVERLVADRTLDHTIEPTGATVRLGPGRAETSGFVVVGDREREPVLVDLERCRRGNVRQRDRAVGRSHDGVT